MEYLFPFKSVPKGSRIVLFGTGDVGKDFYLQLRELEDYYTLVLWTATTLDGYELNKPFDYARNIPGYDFDYIVIAAVGEHSAREVKEFCLGLGVPEEKLIWAPGYYQTRRGCFSQSKTLMLKHLEYYMTVLDERRESESMFGGQRNYQSFFALGLPGERNSGDRIALYRIPELLTKEQTVLDIGCNCGFFSLQVAPYVKHVTGIDIDPHLIRIGNCTRDLLNIQNADFYCRNLWDENGEGIPAGKYDVIFAFAIYHWIITAGVLPDRFVKDCMELLNDGGYLFFESQDVKSKTGKDEFHEMCGLFVAGGMEVTARINYPEGSLERELWILRKRSVVTTESWDEALVPWNDRLYTPTQITKIGRNYFIVDCWHSRVIYNDRLSRDLSTWKTLEGPFSCGHTVASNGKVLVIDSTEADELLVYRINGEGSGDEFTLTQTIDVMRYLPEPQRKTMKHIRPHYVLYDEEEKLFIVALSYYGGLMTLVENDGALQVTRVIFPDVFRDTYLKFVSKVDGAYWACNTSELVKFKFAGDTIEVLARYHIPIPCPSGGINHFAKSGSHYYLTFAAPNRVYEFDSFDDLDGYSLKLRRVDGLFHTKGIPYIFSEFDGAVWLTEMGSVQRISRLELKDERPEFTESFFEFGGPTRLDITFKNCHFK